MFIDLTALFARRRVPGSTLAPRDGVTLGVTDEGVAVHFPPPAPERASHATILAASGAGKTVMLGAALAGELAADPTLGAILVDPKGDLGAMLIPLLARLAPGRLESLVYLDPFAGGFPFNLLRLPETTVPPSIRATQLAELVATVSTATGAQRHLGAGARQMDCLANLLLGALAVPTPGASLLYALDALTQPRGMKALAAQTTSERAKAFLLSANLSDELRASTAARLRSTLAATESLEALIAAPGCLDLAALTAPGAIVLLDLGRPTGGLQSLQAFYANVLLRLLTETLMERPSPWAGHHTRLVVDEAQVVVPVLADVAERILTTGRSRGISLVTLSQGTTLIADAAPTLLRVLFTNTPTKIVGRLAAPDAELLVREQAPTPGVDEPIARLRTRLAARIATLPDRTFLSLTPGGRERFVSADVDLVAAAAAATAQAAAITAIKGRYALPPNAAPRSVLSGPHERPLSPQRRSHGPPEAPPEPTPPPSPARSRWG